MKPILGFVGLGNMGLPLCQRLIDQGYSVFLYDVNPAALAPFEGTGAQASASLAHLARHTEVILLSLPNSTLVERVILGEEGLGAGLSAGQVRLRTFLSSVQGNGTLTCHTII